MSSKISSRVRAILVPEEDATGQIVEINIVGKRVFWKEELDLNFPISTLSSLSFNFPFDPISILTNRG